MDDNALERLVRMETKLDAVLATNADLEHRVRSLERRQWPLPSLALLIAVISTIPGIVILFGG